METIFDHNPTTEEVQKFARGWDKDKYCAIFGQDSAFVHLVDFYFNRGEIRRAEAYADKLPPLMRLDALRTMYHT